MCPSSVQVRRRRESKVYKIYKTRTRFITRLQIFSEDKKIELGQEESSILPSAIIRVEATTIAMTKRRRYRDKKKITTRQGSPLRKQI